jgi:hypothetical protein
VPYLQTDILQFCACHAWRPLWQSSIISALYSSHKPVERFHHCGIAYATSVEIANGQAEEDWFGDSIWDGNTVRSIPN